MERHLATPVYAEIDTTEGGIRSVCLIAYLGDNRWRALDEDRRERIVAAHEIRSLDTVG